MYPQNKRSFCTITLHVTLHTGSQGVASYRVYSLHLTSKCAFIVELNFNVVLALVLLCAVQTVQYGASTLLGPQMLKLNVSSVVVIRAMSALLSA